MMTSRIARAGLSLQALFSRQEVRLLAALFGVAALLLAFGLVAEEVLEGDFDVFDRHVTLLFRDPAHPLVPIGPLWLHEAMRDVTSLGSTIVLLLILLLVLGYLLMAGARALAVFVFVSVAGGQLISTFLKMIIDRPRPELLTESPRVFTASFPSGHAMLSAITYLTLGALLTRLEPRRLLKVYIMSAAILLTLLVGTSRVYLGVHWPSDVLAGWCLGSAWALLCLCASLWLRPREESSDHSDRTTI